MITIALAIEHTDDRAAITALLKEQADFRVVRIGADGYDALKAASTLYPDIIIMDFTLEDIGSLELAPLIKRKSPSTALIVLCSPDEQDAAVGALKSGISGYLLRQDGYTYLASSIRSVYYGGWYISKSTRDLMLRHFSPEPDNPPLSFTSTEMGIFYGIINGHTDREIAKNLNINIGSLRNCINRVKKKTGLQNRSQLIIHALGYRQTHHCGI